MGFPTLPSPPGGEGGHAARRDRERIPLQAQTKFAESLVKDPTEAFQVVVPDSEAGSQAEVEVEESARARTGACRLSFAFGS